MGHGEDDAVIDCILHGETEELNKGSLAAVDNVIKVRIIRFF